jgi:trimeric autotransporter adhesin
MKKIGFILIAIVCIFCGVALQAQTGIVTTIAGTDSVGYSGDGGAATNATMWDPSGIAVDAGGNVYFCDEHNYTVRKITPSGYISTIAGTGTSGFSGDGGAATAAAFSYTYNIAIDASGNLFVVDDRNQRIRQVSASGIVNTVAGSGSDTISGDGGPATAAGVEYPSAVAVDGWGNIYIGDYENSVIRKVNTSGIITTIAGNFTAGFSGDGGPATAAAINQPWGIAVDGAGNIFFTDYNNYCVRKINASGIISTVAGTPGVQGYGGDGGPATAALFSRIYGIVVDPSGNLYVADAANYRIRKIDASGIITTIAGNGIQGHVDGSATGTAKLYFPYGLARANDGTIYFTDDNTVRKLWSGTTAVLATAKGNAVDIYPNPSNGRFTVAVPTDQQDIALCVTDIYGKIVMQENHIATLKTEINLNYPPGTYIIRVSSATNVYFSMIEVR